MQNPWAIASVVSLLLVGASWLLPAPPAQTSTLRVFAFHFGLALGVVVVHLGLLFGPKPEGSDRPVLLGCVGLVLGCGLLLVCLPLLFLGHF